MENETTKELKHRIELMEKEMEILKLKLELAEKDKQPITHIYPSYPYYVYPNHLYDSIQ